MKKYLITSFIALVVISGVLFYQQYALTHVSSSNDVSFHDNNFPFTFEYPNILSISNKNNEIDLDHSIEFKHPNPCDFKGDAPPFEKLYDFHVSLFVVNMNLQEYVEKSTYPGWDYVSANPYKYGQLSGYKIMSGVEGCGEYIYYFTISPTRTLIIKRSLITELSGTIGESKDYLKLKGIILPSQEEQIFTKILSSIVVDKTMIP